jgi:hypothetical protein
MERSLVWVDCQSRKDWLNLWGVDPSAVSRIANARFIEAEEVRGILWRYTPPEIAAGKMYSDYLAEVTPAGQTDWQ